MAKHGKIKDFKYATRQKKAKKMRAEARKPLTTREVSNAFMNVPEPFSYVVFFERKNVTNATRTQDTNAVKDFVNHGFSGKWSMCFDGNYRDKAKPFLSRLYLEEESDLVMLRLCHNLSIRRITKIIR